MKYNILLQVLLVNAAKICSSDNKSCIVSTPVDSQTCFTLHSMFGGWAAVGVGSNTMTGADIVFKC